MNAGIECDYLVVGAGAMGLAFADELHTQRPREVITIVDRRAKPGGHWNDAYRFVSLHQPAAFYGVNSLHLGPGGAALATGSEVLTYYEKVLGRLLRSSRIRFVPHVEYRDGALHSLVTPDLVHELEVRKKVVDATYMQSRVPSTSPPAYDVRDGAAVVPPNALVALDRPHSLYVVVGAGKTGMDAILFLLDQGVAPEHIQWIRSNDAWLLDRGLLTPGRTVTWFVRQLELIAGAKSLREIFLATEEAGSFLRLDAEVWPTKFRCATVDRREVEALRRIDRVVREGRVTAVEPGRIVLDEGELDLPPDALVVDCTADGLARRAPRPVFEGGTVTLQSLFMCQQVFSAAFIGYLESRFEDDRTKNHHCEVVPHPEVNVDYLAAMATSNRNFETWSKGLSRWLRRSRLSLAHHEAFWSLLKNTFKAKRVTPAANRRIEEILGAQAH